MKETSEQGVAILRALAIAVRSDEDFGLLAPQQTVVGVFKEVGGCAADIVAFKQSRASGVAGVVPLKLRLALNKIVHADPSTASYFVGVDTPPEHDLLLLGRRGASHWFAAISLPRLISAIRALPDAALVTSEPGEGDGP